MTPHDFYTQTGGYSDLSTRAVWHDILGDASVMRVNLARPLPNDLIAQTLSRTKTQFADLITALRRGFAPDPVQPLPLQAFTETDLFFAAKNRFHIGRTCNVRVGVTMRAAGPRFGIWTPLSLSIQLSHAVFQDLRR